jgi:hypothetical protein
MLLLSSYHRCRPVSDLLLVLLLFLSQALGVPGQAAANELLAFLSRALEVLERAATTVPRLLVGAVVVVPAFPEPVVPLLPEADG